MLKFPVNTNAYELHSIKIMYFDVPQTTQLGISLLNRRLKNVLIELFFNELTSPIPDKNKKMSTPQKPKSWKMLNGKAFVKGW